MREVLRATLIAAGAMTLAAPAAAENTLTLNCKCQYTNYRDAGCIPNDDFTLIIDLDSSKARKISPVGLIGPDPAVISPETISVNWLVNSRLIVNRMTGAYNWQYRDTNFDSGVCTKADAPKF